MWKTYVGFLSAVLQIKPESIRETCILNTNLRKEYEDDKQGILDVRLLMDDDVEIDIEIQLSEMKVWVDRSLFYLSKMYVERILPGQDYKAFKKCVSISILDFNLFRGEQNFTPAFIYGRIHTAFYIQTKWNSMSLSFPNCRKK